MGNFGEDLRMERLSRGVALEEITAVTKISQHHLVALEQERFRLLPGGILSKGIVRGYTGALGLDQHDWTERFLKAYRASGLVIDDDRSWTAFAANVGKARMMRRDAMELRLRWAGAILLLLIVAAATFLTVRYLRHPRRLVVVASACASIRRIAPGSLLCPPSPLPRPLLDRLLGVEEPAYSGYRVLGHLKPQPAPPLRMRSRCSNASRDAWTLGMPHSLFPFAPTRPLQLP
jgi:cytoskeleton protein RodZ